MPNWQLTYWQPDSLPTNLSRRGCHFIRQRFYQCWHIHRVDITEASIQHHANVILSSELGIQAWLGLEEDGEIANVCINHHHPNTLSMSLLINFLRSQRSKQEQLPNQPLYARVPLEHLASAKAFLASGFVHHKPIKIEPHEFGQQRVNLIRLDDQPAVHEASKHDINQTIRCARELDLIRHLRRQKSSQRQLSA